jgi:hypothetical protein
VPGHDNSRDTFLSPSPHKTKNNYTKQSKLRGAASSWTWQEALKDKQKSFL